MIPEAADSSNLYERIKRRGLILGIAAALIFGNAEIGDIGGFPALKTGFRKTRILFFLINFYIF